MLLDASNLIIKNGKGAGSAPQQLTRDESTKKADDSLEVLSKSKASHEGLQRSPEHESDGGAHRATTNEQTAEKRRTKAPEKDEHEKETSSLEGKANGTTKSVGVETDGQAKSTEEPTPESERDGRAISNRRESQASEGGTQNEPAAEAGRMPLVIEKGIMRYVLEKGSGDVSAAYEKERKKATIALSKGVEPKHILHTIYDRLLSESDLRETARAYVQGNIKRNAYSIDWTSFDEPIDELLYIPLNRLRRVHQTEKATNWDKVVENINKMHRGEGLAPIVIGYDYDIIDGQHRWEASNSMNFTHVPCVVMRGTNEIDRRRAVEAYQEVWKSLVKSWDESKHPRDEKGRFTKVYHITRMKDFKHDPNYRNSGQEWGSGLYTTPAEGIEYWHKALQNKATGERHPYAVPLDISAANLIEVKDIPDRAGRAQAILKKYGSGKAAIEALKREEMEQVTGETYDMRPHEIAEYRVYAKANGFDGLIAHDETEGYQIILFNDGKVKYHPAEDIYEVMKRVRQGNP